MSDFFSLTLFTASFTALGAISIPVALLTGYLILTKTPKAMGASGAFLLNVNVWYCVTCFVFSILMCSSALDGLEGIYCHVFNAKIAVLLGSNFGHWILVLSTLFTYFLTVSWVLYYVYRSAQITNGRLAHVMNSALGVIVACGLHLIPASYFSIGVHYSFIPKDTVLSWHNNNSRAVQEALSSNLTFHCYDVANSLSCPVTVVYWLSCGVIIVVSLVISVRNLKARKVAMSKRTYELQRIFTYTSVVLVCVPIVVGIVPNVVLLTFMFTEASGYVSTIRLCFVVMATLPTLHCVAAVAFTKPYRLALLRILRVKK